MQAAVETVTVDESVSGTASRSRPPPATTRTSWWVPRRAVRWRCCSTSRAYAVVSGRDFVTPEDVKTVAQAALAHRITVKPELWMSEVTGSSVVTAVLNGTPAPAALEPAGLCSMRRSAATGSRRTLTFEPACWVLALVVSGCSVAPPRPRRAGDRLCHRSRCGRLSGARRSSRRTSFGSRPNDSAKARPRSAPGRRRGRASGMSRSSSQPTLGCRCSLAAARCWPGRESGAADVEVRIDALGRA